MHVSSSEGGGERKIKRPGAKKTGEEGCTECVRSDDLDAIRLQDNAG